MGDQNFLTALAVSRQWGGTIFGLFFSFGRGRERNWGIRDFDSCWHPFMFFFFFFLLNIAEGPFGLSV